MGRPPLPLETWGKITTVSDEGAWVARAYYRDSTGRRKRMERRGASESKATNLLREALRSKINDPASGELLSQSTTVASLADLWFEEFKLTNESNGTRSTYKSTINARIKPGIGGLRLHECTVPRVDKFLKSLSSKPSAARMARGILKQMFDMAVRHGAMAQNVATATATYRSKSKKVTALSAEDAQAMRREFAAHDVGRSTELGAISAVLMATGCRTGEVLALRWQDIDLTTGVLRVTGTLVTSEETGELIRQDHPKSEAGERGLKLPKAVLTLLEERRVNSRTDKVFPSEKGTWRWPNNLRRGWRSALDGSVYEGKTPKDFRKAVATHLDRHIGSKAAQAQLGHESDDITTRFYIERQESVADFAEVIQELFESNK